MSQRYYLDETDMERLRMFVFELQRLAEHLHATDNPEALRLAGLLKRFQAATAPDRIRTS